MQMIISFISDVSDSITGTLMVYIIYNFDLWLFLGIIIELGCKKKTNHYLYNNQIIERGLVSPFLSGLIKDCYGGLMCGQCSSSDQNYYDPQQMPVQSEITWQSFWYQLANLCKLFTSNNIFIVILFAELCIVVCQSITGDW